ncbi:dienelactone hydrolase family protein [Micromonospora sp. NPDC050397]|uniref:dienelactone hydrolase family protein n=1 Tax=Micromonospora sp. NPDC050397 TaxID=3364279 RepID=UPI00384F8764
MKRRTLASLPVVALAQAPLPAAPVEASPAPHPAPVTVPVPPVESPAVVEGNLPVFFERLKAELRYPLAWENSRIRDFRTWQRAAAAKVEELLRQAPDHTPFRPEIVDERPADGYRQRRLLFNVTRHSRVRASMLVPDGPGPFPAVLLLHDHGSKFDIGKEKLVRPWYDDTRLASARDWSARYFGGRFVGDELASRGYLVLAVDAFGWGDRSGLTYDAQQALASNLFHLGSSLAGLMAREDVRAAALLHSLPEVDRGRIATLGFSMGGYRAWQTAALSPHVSALVSVCWMTTLKEMMVVGNNTLRGQSAYHMLHPGLYDHLDIPDVASIAAPRPAFFLNGESDPLFTAAGTTGAYAKMRAVWHAQRADNRLRTTIWPGVGHVFTPEMQDHAYAWLDRWLKR